MSNKAQEELPSESDITRADDMELQEIAKNTNDLISHIQTQTDDLLENPLCELLGLDAQLRTHLFVLHFYYAQINNVCS